MGASILIIDNDAEYVLSIRLLLSAQGYQVDSAADGDEGFAKAFAFKPDCILLDVMMRYVSEGLDVAAKLRDHVPTASIPVILITGIRKPEYLTDSYQADSTFPNIRAMLEKPVKPDTLLAHLSRVIASNGPRPDNAPDAGHCPLRPTH